MTRPILYVSALLALGLAAGCSNSPTGPGSSTQVNYAKGQTYIYYAQVLDKSTGDTVAGSGDTVTSVVLATGMTYPAGSVYSNVAEIQNTHTRPASGDTVDTTYIDQSNGDYWHYNYGVQTINGNTALLAAINNGNPIQVGWVLQSKFSANPGDKWSAMNDTIHLPNFGSAVITDTATESNDTSITVGTSQVVAKHSVHRVILNAGLVSATETVDTYLSTQDGIVLDVDHPTTVATYLTPGLRTILIATK